MKNPILRPNVTWTASALLVLFLLVYLRPYYGIRHDAVLYLGQALLHWQPEQFGQDLFFAYGSQAQFTLFPQLAAWLLPHFGAAELFRWGTLVGLVAFVVGSAVLLARLLPVGQRYYALLALLILPSGYGGWRVFSYAEPFLTARSLSEPLVLLSLAAYIGGSPSLAAASWLFAAALHPLQSVPAALAIWLDRVAQDRRWLHLLWLPLLAALVGALGWPPFDRFIQTYDAQWFSWIEEPNRHVFITRWQTSGWGYLLTDLFLGWLVLRQSEGALHRFARMVLVATLLGCLAALLLADGLHLVFFTGLQLWRTQWLLHWLAMACVPWLLLRQWRADGGFSTRLLMLLAFVVLGTPGAAGVTLPLVALLALLYLYWDRLKFLARPVVLSLVKPAILFALLLAVGKHIHSMITIFTQADGSREVIRPEYSLFSYPLVAAGIVTGGLWLWQRRGYWCMPLLITLIAASLYAFSVWDRRNTWTRYIEAAQFSSVLFGVELRPAAQVYWTGELVAPWLILNRPSYFNGHQTSGLLFNRGTAEEAYRREEVLRILSFQENICDIMNALNSNDSCAVDDAVVAEACAKADGQLDYLVLNQKLRTSALGEWRITGGLKGDRPITYRLYQCRDFTEASRGNGDARDRE